MPRCAVGTSEGARAGNGAAGQATSDEDTCFIREIGVSAIECDALRAAAAGKPKATLLDLKGNCMRHNFGGLSRLFPHLQSLVLSNNVLGESLPSSAPSWGLALVNAAPASLQRLDVTGNGLTSVPWDDLATLNLLI